MFEHLRETLRDLMEARVAPADRRALLAQMKDTLVQARVGLADLRSGIATTRSRLEAERRELATVERRRALAEGIGDTETVGIAERYQRMHAERVAVLERKLEAQEAELFLAEGEVDGMTKDLKAAMAGVGSATPLSIDPMADPSTDPTGLGEDEALQRELDAMGRSRGREAKDARAEEMLAALKRRMGK